MTNQHLLRVVGVFFMVCLAVALPGEDSRQKPVVARYCDGTSLSVYPFSLVTAGDGHTFSCYEVQTSSIPGGTRFAFEDADDSDYNDIIIDLWLTDEFTATPQAHVRFVSKDADYLHWVHLGFGSETVLVFKAEEAAPGQMFTVPLPPRPCPDFRLAADRDYQRVVLGARAYYSIRVVPENGFTAAVNLELSGLPSGASYSMRPPAILPGDSAELEITPGAVTPAGDYTLMVSGQGGGHTHALTLYLTVEEGETPSIRKTVDKPQARPGDSLEYWIRVINSGQLNRVVRISDEWPVELEFVSQESPFSFTQSGRRWEWRGEMAPAAEVSIRLLGRIPEIIANGTLIRNQAEIRWGESGDARATAFAETRVSSEPASVHQVRFRKSADLRQTEIGRSLRFTLTVENGSRSPLHHLRLEDDLPHGFSYVPGSTLLNFRPAADPSGGNRLLWEAPTIQPGQTLTLSFQTVIGSDTRRGRNINNARLGAVDSTGAAIVLEAQEFVQVDSDSLVFLAGVQGTVFLDRDDDAIFDPGDTPLSGIEVRLSNGQAAVTDAQGQYSFSSLFAGEYALGLNRNTLPEKYTPAAALPLIVVLNDGLTDTVEIPLRFRGDDPGKTSRLEGRVFFDRNRNRKHEAEEPLVSRFQVMLDGRQLFSGQDGRFVFSHVPPGRHKLEIRVEGRAYPLEIDLSPGGQTLDIPIPFGEVRISVKGEKT